MLLNLYCISKPRFQRLLDHYQNHGISLRTHGNSKRLPHNTLPQAIAEDVNNFLSNYAQENAVLPTRRIPGFKDEDNQQLSSSDTTVHVWNSFKRVFEESNKQVVSCPKFTFLWKQFHPNIVVAKPMMTCASPANKILPSYFKRPIFQNQKCLTVKQNKNTDNNSSVFPQDTSWDLKSKFSFTACIQKSENFLGKN